MRTLNMAVLAIALLGSASAWAQAPRDVPAVLPPSAAAGVPAEAAPPPATISIGVAPTTPALPGVPGPLDYPAVGEGEVPIPPNCVPERFWLRADYVLWYLRRQNTLPLIQTVPTNQVIANTFTEASAATLFPSGDRLNYNGFSGLRLDTGVWFDPAHDIGLDLGGFDTAQNSKSGQFASNAVGFPSLARFYTNANTSVPTALFFANPDPANTYSGALAANSTVDSIYSGEINLRFNGYRVFSDNTDWIAGLRYFHLDDKLNIGGAALLSDGTRLTVADQFKAQNNFYGAQGGISARWCGPWGFSFDGTFKLAIGDMSQTVSISGSNTLISPTGVASTNPYGLYARPSNIGDYNRNKFAVIPELTLNLNYNITQHFAIFAGWNFLYMNNAVVRAANEIDPRVNDSQIRYIANPTSGNAPGPVFAFRDQTFWMQGLNVGVRLEY